MFRKITFDFADMHCKIDKCQEPSKTNNQEARDKKLIRMTSAPWKSELVSMGPNKNVACFILLID